VLLAKSLGLTTVHWDVISGDASATALALPAIITGLKAEGFILVTVEHPLGH